MNSTSRLSLHRIAQPYMGDHLSDKGTTHSYLDTYAELFECYRDLPIRFIEVGVKSGASIAMWAEYFVHPETVIIGIDKKLRSYQIDLKRWKNVKLCLGDASSRTFMASIMTQNVDVFIDDGSHDPIEQLKTLNIVLPKINVKGTYVVEDVCDLSTAELLKERSQQLGFSNIDILHRNIKDDILLIVRI